VEPVAVEPVAAEPVAAEPVVPEPVPVEAEPQIQPVEAGGAPEPDFESIPPEPTVVERTRVFIDTQPRGMEVYVDGEYVGKSPQQPKLALGTRNIEVRHPRTGESQSKTIDVKRSGRNLLTFKF
jgi:hypothetical protein